MIKKFPRYFSYLLVTILIPIIFLIIIIFKPFVTIRFMSISSNRIGHFAGNVEIYLCEKDKRKDTRKYYDICFYQTLVSNVTLAEMWRKKLNILPNYFIFPIYFTLEFFSKFLKFLKVHIVKNESIDNRDYNNYLDNTLPQLKISNKQHITGIKFLKEFGLSKNDKFVCFIVRDDAYLSNIYHKKDWSYWSYRNYDIDDFILAAEELTKLGYFVFRMGKLTQKKMVTKNKMIIDYSKSPIRNDFLDIYLGANCEFCLTTDVGFDYIPFIFRRPLASITDPISLIKFSSKKFLNIYSDYFSTKDNRKLSLSEIFEYNLAYFSGSQYLYENNIKLIHPDKYQIRDLVLDMIDYIKNDFKLSEMDEKLQTKFFEIYKKKLNSDYFKETFLKELKNETDISKLHKEFYGRISPSFITKNKILLN